MSVSVAAELGLARTLADCALGDCSGIVTSQRGKHRRLFCVTEGRLRFVGSNVIEEQFSERLVEDELISVGDLAAALQQADRQQVKLTRLLLDEGIVAEPALMAALEAHARELLFSTLDWADAESTFARGQPNLGDEVTLDLACVPLLIDYAQSHPEELETLRARIGAPAKKMTLIEERSRLLADLSLPAAMSDLLTSADGTLTIDSLIERNPEPLEQAWRSLYALSLIGVVERVTARDAASAPEAASREEILARVARAEDMDYYGILDVTVSATREKIREAYYTLARTYHPDRFGAGPMADLREVLESYFAKVTEAYNTLYDPAARTEYDEQQSAEKEAGTSKQDAAYLANENFRRGQALIGRGRFKDATQSMENAIQLDPRNPVYRLEAGRLLARNPRLRDRAIEHLIETNRLDPSLAEGYFELGQLYMKMSRRTEALQLFQETLRWEAGHVKAKARIREIGKG